MKLHQIHQGSTLDQNPCKQSRDGARVYSPIGLETNKLSLGEGGWGVLKVGEEWLGDLV